MPLVRAKVVISGRVQGVWFRQSTKEEAQRQQVTGWCRNCPDGSVEAVFEGEDAAVKRMIAWCRQGPKMARVARVDVEWLTTEGDLDGFQIRS